MYFRMALRAETSQVLDRIGATPAAWHDMVEMGDGFLTHQTFSMLLGTDGFLYIIISFQRTVLEIHTHSFRVFHMHERKPVDFKCDVCDRQIPADLPDDVQMCLHQMLHRWGDPVRTAFPVAEPGLGVPDELTGHKSVRSIHGQFPHDHAGLHHGTISFCKSLAGFSFPSPGCLPAFLAVSHQFFDLLVPGLDHCGEQQASKRGQDCGPDVRPARILRQRYRLEDGRVAVCQPDRKRDILCDPGPARFQQLQDMPFPSGRHLGFPVKTEDIDIFCFR